MQQAPRNEVAETTPLVEVNGIEPSTQGLEDPSSTAELYPPVVLVTGVLVAGALSQRASYEATLKSVLVGSPLFGL